MCSPTQTSFSMEFELTSTVRRANHQHSRRSTIVSRSLRRRSTAYDAITEHGSHILFRIRRRFFSCIKLKTTAVLALTVFTGLIILIGVVTVCLTSRKPDRTCDLTFKRTMKSSLIASSQPRSLAVGDLNNDHHLDIVVTHSGTHSIGIFLSQDEQNFTNQQIYSTGQYSSPYSIAVDDLDHDKHLDIIVGNYGTNSIGIFLGDGDGIFSEQKLVSLGSSRPLFLAIGDMNNDNHNDIVIANYGTNTIGILLGYGNGFFQDLMAYSTGYDSLPYSLVIGDFNHDQKLDIAVANYGTDNIGIFLGHGNGSFASQQTYSTRLKSNPVSIALGDFNNDHHLDIVVTNNATGNIGIFFGHGNGTFLAQIIPRIDLNAYPQQVTVGHFNQDRILDIVIVDSRKNQIHILPGYGNGTFATVTTYDTLAESNPIWITVTDFNNDNQSDIVVAQYNLNNILILMNYSIQPSVRRKNYDVGTPDVTSVVAVNDLNHDQIFDIVSHTSDSILILMGLDHGTFDKETTFFIGNQSNVQYMSIGDLNNDTHMDIVIADIGYHNVGILLGHGNGSFATIMSYSTGPASRPYWIVLSDINNDDRLDIICANKGSSIVGIFHGYGDGTFAAMIPHLISPASQPTALAVDDINYDNFKDIVVSCWSGHMIILLGYGNDTFGMLIITSVDANYGFYGLALADLDNDNHLDIAVVNPYTDNLYIFLGYGNGTFTDFTIYPTGQASRPQYIIVMDFNNDVIYDIAVSNYDTDEIIIFYGSGHGLLKHERTYSTGSSSNPSGFSAADLNKNQQFEIVVALSATGQIAILTEYNAAEFVHQTTYSTGSALQPYSIAVGDLNNDNLTDIVVVNSGIGNLSLLIGLDNQSFDMTMMHLIESDSHAQYVMTFDVNNDRQIDIITVNSKIDSISVIIGYGNGSFATQTVYSTGYGSNPSAITVNDVNNDNRVDLIVANYGTNNIGILFGFNYTSFQSQNTYFDLDSKAPTGIVVADFNNDTYLDVIVTFYGSESIGIMLGMGNGSFGDIMTYSTGSDSKPWGIVEGDFNNDNQLDLVVANMDADNIGLFLAYGNGSFGDMIPYYIGKKTSPIAVAVGMLNDDHNLDIVVTNYDGDNITVLLGNGHGNFSIRDFYSTGLNSIPRSVIIVDVNNDHRMDIIVANYYLDSIGVFLGYGDGTFQSQLNFSTSLHSRPFWITVGYFDNDNQLDIATANHLSNNVGILRGYGNGTFSSVITYSTGIGSSPTCIRIGDFNHDNISDIAVALLGINGIVVLFGVGDGSFLLGTPYVTGKHSQPFALAIGKFNHDSQFDIAVVNTYENNIGILFKYISQSFAGVTTYSTGDESQPHSVAVHDMNNDGWLDIIVANYGTDNVGILFGRGKRLFDNIRTYSTGTNSGPYSTVVADFNNDHQLDIVVINSKTDNLILFSGYGNKMFTIGGNYSTGVRSRPYAITIGDFNNDNIIDIAIANSGTSHILLFYGLGNGTFGYGLEYPLGYRYEPYSIASTDLNYDNRPDIVIACYNTDHIETLIQMC